MNRLYPTAGMAAVLSLDRVRDGLWHCHEIWIKLNTTGRADGEVKYWLDGEQTKHLTDCDWKAENDQGIASTSLGIGNTGSTALFQSSWRAIEYDDYVVSTSYVGPDDTVAPPDSPQNLKITPK